MVRCRDCGSEKVGWDTTKAGHPYLRDFGQPHRLTCSAKNGQKPTKQKADDTGLVENMTEEQVRAALNARNAEMRDA